MVTNLGFYKLLDVKALCKEPEYKMNPSAIKVTCFSVEDYDTVRALLLKYKGKLYSHERKQGRALRVVLRGLPSENVDNLKDWLKQDHKLDVLKVIKRKGEPSSGRESPPLTKLRLSFHFPMDTSTSRSCRVQ